MAQITCRTMQHKKVQFYSCAIFCISIRSGSFNILSSLTQLIKEPVVGVEVTLGQVLELRHVLVLCALDLGVSGDGLTTRADPVTLIAARVNREQQPALLLTLSSVTQGGAAKRDTFIIDRCCKMYS